MGKVTLPVEDGYVDVRGSGIKTTKDALDALRAALERHGGDE